MEDGYCSVDGRKTESVELIRREHGSPLLERRSAFRQSPCS